MKTTVLQPRQLEFSPTSPPPSRKVWIWHCLRTTSSPWRTHVLKHVFNLTRYWGQISVHKYTEQRSQQVQGERSKARETVARNAHEQHYQCYLKGGEGEGIHRRAIWPGRHISYKGNDLCTYSGVESSHKSPRPRPSVPLRSGVRSAHVHTYCTSES